MVAPMQITLTGASGMVGSALVKSFEAGGHTVRRVVRSHEDGPNRYLWDPESGQIDPAAIEGADAVVNLAGANIAGGRWTAARKRLIRESRVLGTTLLARCIADAKVKPRVLVNASGVGYYGVNSEAWLDEDSAHGGGFLAGVCREWEKATGAAATAGVRVVLLRMGVVISAKGGALGRLLPIFRSGLGGPIGEGKMWMSWISIDDLAGAVEHVIGNAAINGPVNAVSPNPITNREFSKALGEALHRPALLRTPAWAVRLAFGEMADETVLASARARPRRLVEAGFDFKHPEIGDALARVLVSNE